jgi:UDP-hydrolysing UDP-N-acetyl-D-glucosamine 2-epimerase
MEEIKNTDSLEMVLFVGASALLDKFGDLAKIIEEDGFKIDEYVYLVVDGYTPATMAKSTGLGLIELPSLLFKHQPDFTLIIGDRHEMLAMAITSAFMNIPVVHTMGGELSGTIDGSIRHAITKLAHVHLPANEQAKKNIIKMGEIETTVFNVGCPRIDYIKKVLNENHDQAVAELIRSEGVGEVFEVDSNFLLISQHPDTLEFGRGENQITETLMAALEVSEKQNLPVIVLWPNADAGSDEISRGIRKFREKYQPKKFHFFKNLSLPIYIQLMKKTKCLIGNSSSGIREGAFIGTPAVNIGLRQIGRQQGANVINVGYNRSEIKNAILKQIAHGPYPSEPIYGDGQASKKIVEILSTVEINPQKNYAPNLDE